MFVFIYNNLNKVIVSRFKLWNEIYSRYTYTLFDNNIEKKIVNLCKKLKKYVWEI